MEIKFEGDKIIFNRILSDLDNFVLDFIKLLDKAKVSYVLVSGYLAIVFGRTRGTEDVDILIKGDVKKIVPLLSKNNFGIINCTEEESEDFIKHYAIRIARKNQVFPNIELKLAKNEEDFLPFQNNRILVLNNFPLNISCLELQIAYKLYLGSEKDYEDARYLYQEFKEKLNKEEVIKFADELKVRNKMNYLGD